MILVVGGSYQGKTEFARGKFGNISYFNQFHLFVKKRLSEGKSEADEVYRVACGIGQRIK